MSVLFDDLVAVAREFLRSEGDRCVVGIRQVLEELSHKFGDRFDLSPDAYKVLDLVEALWADPCIDQVPSGWIDFAWDENGAEPDAVPASGLKALLLGRCQTLRATREQG